MMKTMTTCLVLLLLMAAGAFGQGVDRNAVLAEWDGGKITVGDYLHWWERLSPESRPDLSTPEARADFLNSMITAKVMLQIAKATGEDKHPNVTDWVASRRVGTLRRYLYDQAIEGRLGVDEAEVQRIYEKRLTQINASHIVLPTYDQALAILDSLEAGVPFEDLARRYSTCASGARGGSLGPVRWGDFSERWSTQAFSLEPGEYSQPFAVETGYAIIKVHDKTLLEPADPEAEKQGIRATLLRDDNFAEREAFLDSLRIAYDAAVDIQAVIDLCARYAQAIMDLGITSEVIAENIAPPLSEREKDLPIAGFQGKTFSYGDVVDMILYQPYVIRPKLDDPDEMYGFINRHLNDSLIVAEAVKRGIDTIPEIADDFEKLEQNRIISRLYRITVQNIEIPEDSLRAFYEAHRESYVATPGHLASKIVLPTKEAADSVLEALNEGASFEDLAHERSIDLFTAPEGGDMGFYPVGKDPEFDEFFAKMEVGDIAEFRSVEGHVVVWLRERQDRVPLSFEEAMPTVHGDVSRRFKQAYFDDWVGTKRAELNVKVYEDRLASLDIP